LVENHSIKEERALIVPLAPAESAQPMSWTDKEQTRIKYAGGREYFMSRSSFSSENMMILLKAFSIFKKRQQTNMKLLIAGSAGEPDHIPHEKLETYKYKDDVHAYTGIAEKDLLKMQSAAYGLIQPAELSSAISILNAMQAEVPVVSGRKPDEVSGDTILYSEPFGQESLGEAMIKLFTNEEQRNELIRKGRVWAAQYNIQQSVGLLWEALSSARTYVRH
jgi:glycosyltransferase involved in cell wall biosynthesis